ncbi:MarR family winged helix-turn-helix transcriptional regulator [Sneathiella aquimaris]|uniref:MarR family winged helix-turn-helix transcriptional regulator n=1 Tax=Sneathiella aquimaris TaxID=2599305 RepID=UPI00146A814B|nr:MarR family transcriptional regulator [Sneathiella aquimaris]
MDDIDHIKQQWADQRPEFDTKPTELIGRLLRVSQFVSQQMENTFAKHGLNQAGFDVLATLVREGPPHSLTPNGLLARMMVTSGTMTNRIDQLEKQGLVRRQRSDRDRRSVVVTLTEKGLTVINATLEDHLITQASLVSTLNIEQRGRLTGLLKEWQKGSQIP